MQARFTEIQKLLVYQQSYTKVLDTKDAIANGTENISTLLQSPYNNSSKQINVKPKPKLTNSYIEALVVDKRRARRDWRCS